jgi:hypothetical protein
MRQKPCFAILFSFIIIFVSPGFAEEVIEPELLMVVNSWLSSLPQDDVDHHVLRVCRDETMGADCTQGIYKAGINGEVRIPTYNRCVFRSYQELLSEDPSSTQVQYELYYQIKAVTQEGRESLWTESNKVSIYKHVFNTIDYGSVMLIVNYEFN